MAAYTPASLSHDRVVEDLCYSCRRSALEQQPSARSRIGAISLTLTQLGLAQWFFGNLYEAVVKVPDLQSASDRATTPLGAGSPVRYYIVSMATAFPALLAVAATTWGDRRSRPWVGAAASCSLIGVGLTAYLVRAVNLRLFFGGQAVPEPDREHLLRRWYQLNLVRLVAIAGALLAARQARSAVSSRAAPRRPIVPSRCLRPGSRVS